MNPESSKPIVKRKGYLIEIGYTVKKNKTYVSLLIKGKKKTTKLYYQQDPYFIVDAPEEHANELLNIKVARKNGESTKPLRIEKTEKKVGLKTEKMLKLYCETPSDVPIVKAAVPYKCYEYNIPFARRFIFDMQLTPLGVVVYEREGREIKKFLRSKQEGTPELKLLAFDIETYNPQGAPIEQKDPVIMVSYCGNKINEKDKEKTFEKVLTYKKSSHKYVETLTGEKEVLERFTEIVQEFDPDVLFGYNSANFDLPYLKIRTAVTKANFDIGRFGRDIIPLKRGLNNGVRINGRVHFDLYPMVKFFSFIGVIKTQKHTLDAVAEAVLGKKKVAVKKDEIWQEWDSGNIDKLSEYSLVDSELTLALGEQLMPINIQLSMVAKLSLFDSTLSTSGQMVENLLMYEASARNSLIPSKPGGDTIDERLAAPIQGAYVKLPAPGIYENVAVMDFRGLYPSIIVSYNIDPGTLLENIEKDNTPPTNKVDKPDKNTVVSPTGAVFSKKEQGLVPYVLNYLIDKRMELKNAIKKVDKSSDDYVHLSARSQALKILANSFYGYLGYARSRWYSRPCAESVTAWGRKHITETIESAEKAGFEVLYSDTDSIFLLYKNKDTVHKFLDQTNKRLPDKMELELEGFYPRGVFVSKKGGGDEDKGAKKKYALLGEDGRIKIRGFELVRRDWSSVAKDTQKQVLEAILKDGSKEKAAKIIREIVIKLKEGKVPLEMLAITTQLNKDPKNYEIMSPELTAAKKLIKAGIGAEKGSLISYVVGKSGKSISEKAEPLELAKDYDADYYINNQVMPAVMKIMKELGYDEYSMKVGGKQKSLDSFF
ncbi:hypothetical protein HZC07_01960 [Candidatus Micrarchaeota archaeon]|nr:hypothetical protein [Candidatus Micrarchaeota archaeon]